MAGRGLVRIQGEACRDSPPRALGLLRNRARISEAGARGGRTGPGSGTVGGKRPSAIVGGRSTDSFFPLLFSYIAPPCLGGWGRVSLAGPILWVHWRVG